MENIHCRFSEGGRDGAYLALTRGEEEEERVGEEVGESCLSQKGDFDLTLISEGLPIKDFFLGAGQTLATPRLPRIYELISLISLFNHAPSNRVSLRKD